ncbi:MAG: AI-2E family transporter [Candidatus Acidiferrales bacterium]|jgi:predicted PurR-regulated permease PerM
MNAERIRLTGSTPSQRIIAAAIVLSACYFAAGVIVTLLFSVLLAYFLDPVVEVLERIHIPRVLGSLLVVILGVALVVGVGYFLLQRADQFAGDWPQYSAVLRKGAESVNRRVASLEKHVSEIAPPEPRPKIPTVAIEERSPLRSFLLAGLGSIYAAVLEAAFVPFLLFFMLLAKREVWHATLELFPPDERTRVKEALDSVRDLLRSFMAGTALAGLLLTAVSCVAFWLLGLRYALLLGIVSGLLNMVPYIGLVLAWLPPMLIGLAQWHTAGPFLLVAGVLATLHVLALNVLLPALVGRRVKLNALAVTVSLLFWGWIWGGMGLLLAVPITAIVKVVCDHVEPWRPVGRWLGPQSARPSASSNY